MKKKVQRKSANALEEHITSILCTKEYVKQETRIEPAASRAKILIDSDCTTQYYISEDRPLSWKLY
jgi:hypothetical protein